MPEITITQPHRLGQEEAAARLRAEIAGLKARLAGRFSVVHESLDGYAWSAEYEAYGLRASIAGLIEAASVEARLRLPATPGMIAEAVQRQIGARLAACLA
ncbi:MAG: hypothetical protein ACRD2E_04195 [Terriglobales bacterium]